MFTKTIEPGFYDTDALGHINNTRLPVWFELARNDVFSMLIPEMNPEIWTLILARIELDFLHEIFYGANVEVRTWIEKIGKSSFVVLQEAYQKETLCVRGRATIVHFDWDVKKSAPLPRNYRELLEQHLLPAAR